LARDDDSFGDALPEVRRSIAIPTTGSRLRRFLAYSGPAILISVGYMDPGNWSTDIEGGARHGYQLLWVVVLSSLIAMFLQTLCARLGLGTGRDLASLCRETYPKPVTVSLWILAELAIIACDFAEVVGSAIALKILFNIPLLYGVLLTGLDVLVVIGLMRFGFKKLEAVVTALVATIASCFILQLFVSKPDWGLAAIGAIVPRMHFGQLFIVVGIIGATVMPHNLYLHSAIVQTRASAEDEAGKLEAIRNNTWDTVIALSLALFVNAAILMVAAAAFHWSGHADIAELQQAHNMLVPLLGGASALAFAIGLLAAGQSSTITGTLAGQVVMEGFLTWRIKPWQRRLITRLLAITPAAILIWVTGGKDTLTLLNDSQVLLSMQLPFAIFPLIAFTSNPKYMGPFASTRAWTWVGYAVGVLITAFNIYLIFTTFSGAQ
jgi:manganese transport protein